MTLVIILLVLMVIGQLLLLSEINFWRRLWEKERRMRRKERLDFEARILKRGSYWEPFSVRDVYKQEL